MSGVCGALGFGRLEHAILLGDAKAEQIDVQGCYFFRASILWSYVFFTIGLANMLS